MINQANDIRPKINLEKTNAVFETNNTTYNQAGYTYNQSGWTYGGADRVSDLGAKLESSIDTKPYINGIKTEAIKLEVANDIRPKMMEVENK